MNESVENTDWFSSFWSEGVGIWTGGGWAMIVLGVLAVVTFGLGVHVMMSIQSSGLGRLPERVWRRWLDEPGMRRGKVGALIDSLAGRRSVEQIANSFESMRISAVEPFDRDLRVMRICVTAAPLLGLLGTVTGMLSTFEALSTGSGGDKTMQMVSAGISEALITTETGLVLALPGLFFHFYLTRRSQAVKVFLDRLETTCNQRILKGDTAASA